MDPSGAPHMHGDELHPLWGGPQFVPFLPHGGHHSPDPAGYPCPDLYSQPQAGPSTAGPSTLAAGFYLESAAHSHEIYCLERFLAAMRIVAEHERSPLARQILDMVVMYDRLDTEGRLGMAAPQAGFLLPYMSTEGSIDDSHSSAPGSVGSSQPEDDGPLCKWRSCGRSIGTTVAEVKKHLVEHHLQDIPEPLDAWKTSDLKVACRWRDCDTDLLHRSLSKHISGTHLKSTTVICSIDGCNERLSRGDALKRHVEMKHKG